MEGGDDIPITQAGDAGGPDGGGGSGGQGR